MGSVTWGRYYYFFNVTKKLGEKMAFLTGNNAKLCQNLTMTLFFEKKRKIFAENRRKMGS
jgi:hypothetical protein